MPKIIDILLEQHQSIEKMLFVLEHEFLRADRVHIADAGFPS